ncbi:MAG: MarR family transcriptional regulator [Gammaproteobacteria bacterium]|nr:MarR family transcriptional regulator [Gammaproteobacteria bacterium]
MKKAPHFNLSNFLPYRLSILSNRISQGIAEIYQEKYALSITEWRIMAILGNFENCTATEIVKYTAIDKVAISRNVKKLLERGFIERKSDPDDRRRQSLRLSPLGQEVFDEIIPKAINYEYHFIDQLSSKDLNDLERITQKLFTVLEK